MSFKNIQKQLQNPIIRGFILFPPLIIDISIYIIALINLFLNFIKDASWLFGIYVSVNVYLFIGIFILLYSDFIKYREKYKNS